MSCLDRVGGAVPSMFGVAVAAVGAATIGVQPSALRS